MNLALRQQLIVLHRSVPRPPLEDGDRAFWANLATPWSGWRSAPLLVKPATSNRWHRMGFRWYWRWKCRPGGGRPSTPLAVRQLIRKMSRSNPIWGAPRIRAELARFGITVSEATVARYMIRRPKPPAATWRAFLDNQTTPRSSSRRTISSRHFAFVRHDPLVNSPLLYRLWYGWLG